MFSQKKISVDGITLSCLDWQRGSEPLLLLHGLADCSLVWLELGDYLEEKYHIVAPDLRGHGESDKPECGYRFDDYIRDLESLLSYLKWEKVHVIAHSWSAKLACIWAKKSPNSFKSLALVDPFFIKSIPSIFELTFPILYRLLPFLKMIGPFSTLEEAEKQARQLKQYQGWSSFQQQVFQGSIEKKADGTWGSKFVKRARNEIFLDVMGVDGLTQAIDIPTLLVLPEKGLNRTQWQIKPFQIYLPNLEIARVKGNHWAFLVEPEDFNRTVASFLLAEKINKKN